MAPCQEGWVDVAGKGNVEQKEVRYTARTWVNDKAKWRAFQGSETEHMEETRP